MSCDYKTLMMFWRTFLEVGFLIVRVDCSAWKVVAVVSTENDGKQERERETVWFGKNEDVTFCCSALSSSVPFLAFLFGVKPPAFSLFGFVGSFFMVSFSFSKKQTDHSELKNENHFMKSSSSAPPMKHPTSQTDRKETNEFTLTLSRMARIQPIFNSLQIKLKKEERNENRNRNCDCVSVAQNYDSFLLSFWFLQRRGSKKEIKEFARSRKRKSVQRKKYGVGDFAGGQISRDITLVAFHIGFGVQIGFLNVLLYLNMEVGMRRRERAISTSCLKESVRKKREKRKRRLERIWCWLGTDFSSIERK